MHTNRVTHNRLKGKASQHEGRGFPSTNRRQLRKEGGERDQTEWCVEANGWDLAALVAEIERIRERERKQIADDLHDQLGQNLILATIKLGMLAGSVSHDQLRAIQDVRQLIAQSIDQVRSLISGLCPCESDDRDLGAALECLLEETQKLYGLRCAMDIGEISAALDHERQKILLSVVRELLINVAKHAGVKEAEVSLRCEDQKIVVLVADEGCGFDPKQPRPPRLKSMGLGLISVGERIARLGGSFSVDSRVGQGTKARISLPIKSK